MLPRILFITSEPPHTGAASAIVFHRLLGDYPPDRLRVITNAPPPAGAERLACEYRHLPLLADRAQRTRLWPWRNRLSVLGFPRTVPLRRVRRSVDGFSPDVVVTLLQDSWFYSLAARYARQVGLPLLVFVHDLPQIFEPVPSWLGTRQRLRDTRIVRQADVRLFISTGMQEWYKQSAGVEGDVLLPPRSPRPITGACEACMRLKRGGQLTLGYAGGLHYGYGEQLLRLLPILRETGTRVEMFGPAPGGIVATLGDASDVFHFHGYASTPEEAWQRMSERCDAVLQPYLSPAGAHELQYRTHFPSKLGDALSLGLPLLITGPDNAAGVAWCRAASPEPAAIVTESSLATVRPILDRLRADGEWRVTLARRAQTAARAFDAGALRAQLRSHLQRLDPRRSS